MRMTVYGNNATCPEADGACSCFLIEAEGRRILLDMGNGSLAKLQKDVDLAALDLIAISHLHFDHFGDLFCAKYQLESRRACGVSRGIRGLAAPQARRAASGSPVMDASLTMASPADTVPSTGIMEPA